MSGKISVIIPIYNHAHTLERSLESLFVQTLRPSEIVIINDGSTDDFQATINGILRSHRAAGINVKIINQNNLGAPAARNRGLAEATGDYVIFWDADTVGRPVMLARMFEALQKNPAASYAYSRFRFGWKKMRSHVFDEVLLRQCNYIDVTTLIRRSDFPDSGWDETINRFQDWDLWLTMLENKKIGVLVPEYLYKKIISARKGISAWLPSFAYKFFPWLTRARTYETAKKIIAVKHRL